MDDSGPCCPMACSVPPQLCLQEGDPEDAQDLLWRQELWWASIPGLWAGLQPPRSPCFPSSSLFCSQAHHILQAPTTAVVLAYPSFSAFPPRAAGVGLAAPSFGCSGCCSYRDRSGPGLGCGTDLLSDPEPSVESTFHLACTVLLMVNVMNMGLRIKPLVLDGIAILTASEECAIGLKIRHETNQLFYPWMPSWVFQNGVNHKFQLPCCSPSVLLPFQLLTALVVIPCPPKISAGEMLKSLGPSWCGTGNSFSFPVSEKVITLLLDPKIQKLP